MMVSNGKKVCVLQKVRKRNIFEDSHAVPAHPFGKVRLQSI